MPSFAKPMAVILSSLFFLGMTPRQETKPDGSSCLSRAEQEIAQLPRPFTARILSQAKGKVGTSRWGDETESGVSWLSCDAKGEPTTLGRFLKRWNARLHRDNCLSFPFYSEFLCFAWTEDLPKADSARVSIQVNRLQLEKILRRIQSQHLVGEASLLDLIGETVGWIISTQTTIALGERFGRKAVYTEGDSRAIEPLPMFLLYLTVYGERLKETQPEKFALLWLDHGSNHRNLETILTKGEATYRRFQELRRQFESASSPIGQVEDLFWQHYQTKRKTLFGNKSH